MNRQQIAKVDAGQIEALEKKWFYSNRGKTYHQNNDLLSLVVGFAGKCLDGYIKLEWDKLSPEDKQSIIHEYRLDDSCNTADLSNAVSRFERSNHGFNGKY